MAELVDALVSNTSGKPCRFDSGSGYKSLFTFSKEAFLAHLLVLTFLMIAPIADFNSSRKLLKLIHPDTSLYQIPIFNQFLDSDQSLVIQCILSDH